jgi:hypothetical protein
VVVVEEVVGGGRGTVVDVVGGGLVFACLVLFRLVVEVCDGTWVGVVTPVVAVVLGTTAWVELTEAELRRPYPIPACATTSAKAIRGREPFTVRPYGDIQTRHWAQAATKDKNFDRKSLLGSYSAERWHRLNV